ncbi:MAG TPA: PAS domain-containing protein, partial [Burkholderiaceae bacterium]|nr:PAS domain-containing protein [Burkholderiaceae bacterium]
MFRGERQVPSTYSTQSELRFLNGGGEMGALIRAFDWLSTTLGSPRDWPAALRTTLRLLLTTQHPVFVFWGPEHICFYNDAYRQYLGPEQHPSILGMRGRDAWPETWDLIAPQIDLVMRGGEATWHENQLVPITRNGRREEAYWTYSYGPIDDESAPNGVGGVIVLCTETTDKVLAEQRLTGEIARERRLFEQAPSFICILEQPDHRFVFVNHALIQVFGDRNFIDRPVREVFPELEGQGFFDLLDRVYSTGKRFIARGMPASIQRTPGAPRENLLLDFIYEPVRDENGVVTG